MSDTAARHAPGQAPQTLRFSARHMRRFVTDILIAGGWRETDGQMAADNLIGADQSGHASHGIGLLPGYIEAIQAGRLSPTTRAKVVKAEGPFVVIDAAQSLGQVAAVDATRRGIETSETHGVAIVNLIDAHHIGRVGHYGEMVAAAGMIGLFWVNVHGRRPMVVPYGAREPRFSTNPHCVAIPRPGGEPFLLDFATSELAVNKARVAWVQGKKLRPGMVVDDQGRPTDDPGVLFADPRGSIAPFGLHKGSGLAIACEILAALAGGPIAADGEERGAICNNMMAIIIDPARLSSAGHSLAQTMERMVTWVKQAAAADGVDGVLTPGEPEYAERRRLGDEIEIDQITWERITTAALEMGLAGNALPQPLG